MATGAKKRGLMGLKNCIEILQTSLQKAFNMPDDECKHMTDKEILISISSVMLMEAVGDGEDLEAIGEELVGLCIALSKKNQSDAFMGVGALLCEIDKFFGAKNDEKTRQQIVSSMWCLVNGKRNKKTGLNIILGALLLAEPHGRTSEENNQTLLKIQKALEGVI